MSSDSDEAFISEVEGAVSNQAELLTRVRSLINRLRAMRKLTWRDRRGLARLMPRLREQSAEQRRMAADGAAALARPHSAPAAVTAEVQNAVDAVSELADGLDELITLIEERLAR
jgi:hypothetical protein